MEYHIVKQNVKFGEKTNVCIKTRSYLKESSCGEFTFSKRYGSKLFKSFDEAKSIRNRLLFKSKQSGSTDESYLILPYDDLKWAIIN